jgi:hypothetical protein
MLLQLRHDRRQLKTTVASYNMPRKRWLCRSQQCGLSPATTVTS